MSTNINITVDTSKLRNLLGDTAEKNREDTKQRSRTKQIDRETDSLLAADEQAAPQEPSRTTRRKDELTAQKAVAGYPVAGLWFGVTEGIAKGASGYGRQLRPLDFSAQSESFPADSFYATLPVSSSTTNWSCGGDSTHSYRNYSFSFTYSGGPSNEEYWVLPAGGEKCVFVYFESAFSFLCSGTVTETEEVFREQRQDDYGYSLGDVYYAWNNYYSYDTTFTPGATTSFGSWKAWLIWRDGLREISVPSTLSEKLGQFVVDHSASTLSTTTTTTPGYSDFDEYGFNGSTDGSYTLPCNPGVPPLSNTPSYSGANYSYSRSTVFDVVESSQGAGGFTPGYFIGTYTVSSGTSVATALSYNDTDVTNYSGLSSYEKVPVTKFNSYDGMLFSPGIYYVLDHPELSVSGTLTPEAVKLLYLQELSPKKVSLDMIYVSVEDPPTDYLRFDYYKADTLPYDYDLSGVTPKANNKAKFIDKNYAVEDGHTFYFVGCWDCGRPAYCREQLLSLGFTEEDLTP